MSQRVRPRPAVARMKAFHGIREERGAFLRLDFNENSVGCSPAVRAALRRMTSAQLAMYPEYDATRARLARYFGVRPAELVLTNGADDGLRLVFDTFVDRGDRVLLVEPTFNMYRFWAGLCQARIVELRYESEMRFPLDRVLRVLRGEKPRAFLLANPNNPTGTLVERPMLRKILKAGRHTLVVLDEAYFEFNGVTALPWIRRYPNLMVARTFSKACGLAGLRLGLLFANQAATMELRKAQAPFAVNAAALVAAEAALRDTAFVQHAVTEIARGKRTLEAALAARGVKTFASGGNFLLADFGPGAPRVVRGLEEQGILVRDRSNDFGRPGCVRITVGTRAQMRRLVRALDGLL